MSTMTKDSYTIGFFRSFDSTRATPPDAGQVADAPPAFPAFPKAKAPLVDADALRALAWLERGQPDAEIVYDDDVPRQTAAELREFRPASYIKKP